MRTRVTGFALFALSLFVAFAPFSRGQTPEENLNAIAIHRSLRDVINLGADLFNLQADHAGCYRLYQGSLIAIKPVLRVPQQAEVEKALAEAEKQANFADRAHRLRVAIDAIREQIKPTIEPPNANKPAEKPFKGELIQVPPKKG